ncbi:MAG: phenylpyruvate tautomerase MIF-related protein [Erysipelotrichaceae bacterium]|nr:phenylpyruvate tautomerase MIF-related protein [Erysipelotrichaceae bacterium]
MPYISIKTSVTLTMSQENKIVEELGKLITIIPGKAQERLMVRLEDNQLMYFQGSQGDILMFDIKTFGKAPKEAKEKFAQESFLMLEEITRVPLKNMFLNISETDNWGTNGNYKQIED